MKRLLTGLILTPFFIYIVLFSPHWAFLAALAVVGLFAFYEYGGIVAAHFPAAPRLDRSPMGYAAGLLLLLLPGLEASFLALVLVAAFLLALRSHDLAVVLPWAAALVFGVIYIFGAWRCAVALRAIEPRGEWWLMLALALSWVGDTFAYYTGRAIGRHKLIPRISPAKTWEGTIGSVVGSAIFGVVLIRLLFPQVGLPQALLVGVCGNAAGQLGDLCESAIKRGAGVKDSGNLLPGHGGWLDRVDSSLFSVPVVYWLLTQPWIRP
jgi:phosphatidate cytidylyltransferase